MKLQEAIEKRYSCRKYADTPVPRALLTQLMEAGRLAPSSCNSQRWLFVAVDDPALLAQIAPTMYHETWKINRNAPSIPAFLVVAEHPVRTPTPMQQDLLQPNGEKWIELDLGAAIQNICLTATDLGLGSLIMGWFDEGVVKGVLGIPAEMTVPVVIGIGYPLNPDRGRSAPRLPSEETNRYNHFSITDSTQ